MNTFTRLVEQNESSKKYKVAAYIVLKFNAENEGEAGYKADSILEGIDNYDSHIINNIEEINEFDNDLNENKLIDIPEMFRKMPKELTPEKRIQRAWKEKFEDKEVSNDDKFEFYHQARKTYEGDTIFNALKGKF
jgi:hypothetical protein